MPLINFASPRHPDGEVCFHLPPCYLSEVVRNTPEMLWGSPELLAPRHQGSSTQNEKRNGRGPRTIPEGGGGGLEVDGRRPFPLVCMKHERALVTGECITADLALKAGWYICIVCLEACAVFSDRSHLLPRT
jgi:hypothetical protein